MSIAEVVATTSASLISFSGLCFISNSLMRLNKDGVIYTTAVTASAGSVSSLGAWGLTHLVAQSSTQASAALAAVPHAAAVGGLGGLALGVGVPLATKLLVRLAAHRAPRLPTLIHSTAPHSDLSGLARPDAAAQPVDGVSSSLTLAKRNTI